MANPEVGSRWEVAINDVGYMLADSPGEELGYRRFISVLDPQRFANGATPVSESIERYSFANSSEWRGGAGQRFLNREASDQSSYWDSLGVDPFDEDQRLKLLPLFRNQILNSNANIAAVAGSTYLLMGRFGANAANTYTIAGDTATLVHTYAPSSVTDIDIGFGKGFIATGIDLQELTLGAGGLTTRSTLDIYRVAWIGDRLAVLYRDSATSTWRFSTLAADGTEEIPGGLLTLPGATSATMTSAQFQLGGIAPGPGFVWFSGWTADGDESHIYVWGADVTLSASIALVMPKGEIALDVFFYQGGVYVYAVTANRVKIYRCVVNGDGTLTPFLVVDNAGPAPASLERRGRKFAADGRNVYFAWNTMANTFSGLGVIDLATGGYAKRSHAVETGEINSVYVWDGRPGAAVNERGFYTEHSTDLVTTGYLRTSIYDADSALTKRWDSVSWSQDLGAASQLDIAYTVDDGVTYTQVVSNSIVEDGEVVLGVDAPSLGLQFTLEGNGTAASTPLVRVIAAKFHPIGLLDQLLVLPVNCSDRIADLKGSPVLRAPHVGADQARALELLEGNFVSVQDVDWRQTQAVHSYEVVQVDIRRWMQSYDPSQAAGRQAMTAVVTLRREVLRSAVTGPSNAAPVITNPGTRNSTVNVAITPLVFAATDADSDTLVWGAVGLPPGLSMSPMGTVSGTPTETGAFTVTVYANDGAAQDSETLTWNVA